MAKVARSLSACNDSLFLGQPYLLYLGVMTNSLIQQTHALRVEGHDTPDLPCVNKKKKKSCSQEYLSFFCFEPFEELGLPLKTVLEEQSELLYLPLDTVLEEDEGEEEEDAHPSSPLVAEGDSILRQGSWPESDTEQEGNGVSRKRRISLNRYLEQEMNVSMTSVTASMTSDESEWFRDYSCYEEEEQQTEQYGSSFWDEEVEVLEESNRELQGRIALLQQSLEEARQEEREEIQAVRYSICSSEKKQAAAKEIRMEGTTVEQKPIGNLGELMLQYGKQQEMVNVLQEENKLQMRGMRQISEDLCSILNSNNQLEMATRETKQCNEELAQLLVHPAQEKERSLLAEVGECLLEEGQLDCGIRRARNLALQARHGSRVYGRAVARILQRVHQLARSDLVLSAAINYALEKTS